MLGASMFETVVPGEVLRLEHARFASSGGDHSPTLGKAVTSALIRRTSRAVVRALCPMAIHLAAVDTIRGSSGHHFRQSPADRVRVSSRIRPRHGRKTGGYLRDLAQGPAGSGLGREWFDPMTITNCRGGLAVLTGDIVDQAALHGILNKIRNLNLPLISLTFIEPGREQA